MPVAVRCTNPDCAKTSSFPDEAAGRTVRCPACGRTNPAPAAESRDGKLSATRSGVRPAAPPASAETIGGYAVRGKLGEGMFGAVYRAYDPQLERDVALKVAKREVLADPKRVERFVREAKAAAKLRHPHVVPVFGAGKDGARYFIASAFIDGKPLADAIEERGVEFRRAARLARELAEALAYAHGQGVVHRDVKPANAMVDAADRLHLMDFGLAARAEDSGDAKLTNDGAVLGTPAYMAPEQAAGQKGEAKPAADQYAAGVVLYELLTGETPFHGPPAVVIHNAIHTDPDPPSKRRPGVPKDLETVCLKAMAKRPADRYPSCQEFADDLRRFLDGEPVSARRLSAGERLLRWVRREPRVAAALSVALTSLIALAGFLLVFARTQAQARTRADELLGEAEREREAAKQSAADAKKSGDAAVQAREAQTAALYFNRIALAERQWAGGDIRRGANLLRSCVPPAGQPDPRGWEWHYLDRVVSGSRHTFQMGQFADAPLNGVAFSPDGRRLAVTGSDTLVHILEAETGRIELTLRGHTSGVCAVAFSPDGRRLATGGFDKKLIVWDAITGREERNIVGHSGHVYAVKFFPDGQRLASSGENHVLVWDLATGKNLFAKNAWRGLDIDPAGKRVAAVIDNCNVVVWDAADGRELVTFKGHKPTVNAVVFSPDGSSAATGGTDGIKVWDAATGAERFSITADTGHVQSLAYSPDGRRIVSASGHRGDGYGGDVKLWDAATGAAVGNLRGHAKRVTCVTFRGDGRLIASSSYDGTVKVWPADVTTPGATVLDPVPDSIGLQVAVSGDGRHAAAPGSGGVRVWETATGRTAAQLPSWSPGWVAFDPGGRLLAGAPRDPGPAEVWDWAAGQKVFTLPGELSAVAFHPDGRRLVSAGKDGTVRVWDATTGRELQALTAAGGGPLTDVAVSADGRRVAAAAGPQAFVWDLSGGEGRRIELHSQGGIPRYSNLAISPDGTLLASAVAGGKVGGSVVKVFDTVTGGEVRALDGHTQWVHAVAFSPDGRRLATGGADETVILWDVGSGQEALTLPGRVKEVTSLAFSGSGHVLAAGGWAKTAIVWDGSPRDGGRP